MLWLTAPTHVTDGTQRLTESRLTVQEGECTPVDNVHVGAVHQHEVTNHGNVAVAGREVQRGALVVVAVVHLHIIAAQQELHLQQSRGHSVSCARSQTIVAQEPAPAGAHRRKPPESAQQTLLHATSLAHYHSQPKLHVHLGTHMCLPRCAGTGHTLPYAARCLL